MSSKLGTESKAKRKVKRTDLGSGILKVKTEEERLADVAEQVFSIPLVFMEILKNLEKQDLLRTSLVSKYWNQTSREILKKNFKCLAKIDKRGFCKTSKNLNGLLLTSEVVPFNGISVSVPWMFPEEISGHKCITIADRSELRSNILSKINIKYFDLSLYGWSAIYDDCVTFECIREFLDNAESLEELRVYAEDRCSRKTFAELIGLKLQGHWLPNVRVMEFPSGYFEASMINRRIVQDLVEAAPKLQALYGYISVKDLEFILPLKLGRAVKDFEFRPEFLENLETFSQQNPKLRKISFSSTIPDNGLNIYSEWSKPLQRKLCRIFKQLLISSEDSLETFTVKQPDLVLITFKWNIPALKNVTRLLYHIQVWEGCRTLSKIKWPEYFPNLKEVFVTGDCTRIDFNIGESFLPWNAQFVCKTVTKLTWNPYSQPVYYLHYQHVKTMCMFRKIFPNVKEFYLRRQEFADAPFLDELWVAWPNLETLSVSFKTYSCTTNFDSSFLGITVEEASHLFKNFEELESLEVVSIKPCIFNLRQLKKLVINFHHSSIDCPEKANDAVLLSRLTGQCVFSRIPGLMVEIYWEPCDIMPKCCFNFDHIKPFVKRLLERDSDAFEASF